MAIYRVLLRGAYFEPLWVTEWTYVSSGGTPTGGTALDLIDAMGFVLGGDPPAPPNPSVAFSLQNLQSEDALWNEVECQNLYSDTDFYLLGYNPSQAGLAVGVSTSPVLAYGIRSNRVTLAVRRGFKRFVGVTEEAMGLGGSIVPGYLDAVSLVAERMSEVLTGASGATYTPSILHLDSYTTPSGRTAYRPFPTEAEQLDNAAVGVTWQPYEQVRTQRSRQYGHGS